MSHKSEVGPMIGGRQGGGGQHAMTGAGDHSYSSEECTARSP